MSADGQRAGTASSTYGAPTAALDDVVHEAGVRQMT
jgi:hypothetical protein